MKVHLIILATLIWTPAFADTCMTQQLDGIWKNNRGGSFQLTSLDCDHMKVVDLDDSSHYVFEFDTQGVYSNRFPVDGAELNLSFATGATPEVPTYRGALSWEVPAPYLAKKPKLQASYLLTAIKQPGSKVFDVLKPTIGEFSEGEGSTGNFFDDALKAVAGMLNQLHVPRMLTPGVQQDYTLYRIKEGE